MMGTPDNKANPLSNRVATVGLSIFSEMSNLAVRHQAINLGQGFPDFPGPDWIKQAAIEAIAGDINQYAISHGSPRLRQQLARTLSTRLNRQLDPERDIVVTSGATEAIFCAMQALIEPGDEVIVFEPSYESYGPAITYAGGTPHYVPLYAPDVNHLEWWFAPEELEGAFGPRTKVVLLNTPHNPTGKVFSKEELAYIAALCHKHNTIVVTDEVYEYLVYGVPHVPIATLPGMWERTITISSGAKTFSLTGWKVGWAVGPEHLVRGVAVAHQNIVFCTAAPLQEGIAAGLEQAEARGYYQELQAAYQARRDFLLAALEDVGLHPYPPQGTYFILCDISGLGYKDDVAFCKALIAEAGVAAIPPSPFYMPEHRHLGQNLARFAFCKRLETLQEAARRLREWRLKHR